MSLLLAHGHPYARRYPLGMVWDESNMIKERQNALEITRATLLQKAVASILSSKAGTDFSKTIAGLNIETKPLKPREGPAQGY